MHIKEEQAKQEILEAAKKLFQKYGIKKTTMEEISESMGKSNKYAYYYFKNKEEIFFDIATQEVTHVAEKIERAMEKETTVAGKIRAFMQGRFHAMRETITLYPITMSEMGANWSTLSSFAVSVNEKFVTVLEMLLKEGVKTGEFKKIKLNECRIMAEVYADIMSGLDSQFAMTLKTYAVDAKLDIFIKNFIRGLE
jgi:AcrR family transcriptional regulator